MNKKGEISPFVWIIMSAVIILIGLALYSGIFGDIGTMTKTSTSENVSFLMPTLYAEKDLTPCGQKNLSAVIIYNVSGDFLVTSGNYTVNQEAGDDGYLSARINATGQPFNNTLVNISCTYEPRGYITDGGSRAIVGIIAIGFAILIMVSALPNVRDKFFAFLRS